MPNAAAELLSKFVDFAAVVVVVACGFINVALFIVNHLLVFFILLHLIVLLGA